MTQAELQHHIQLLLDGEISSGEFAVLETELQDNPEALETYREYARLHCGIQKHCDVQEMIQNPPVVPVDRVLALQRKFIVKTSLLGAAAILILTAVGMWFFQTPDHQPLQAKFQVAPGSDFTLTHSGKSDQPAGKTMTQGSRLVLRHGVAELKLPHDVRAIVEAPAEMILQDDRTLEVLYGRALFQVRSEEGHGFTVVTPHQRIVDLGTVFGIDSQQNSDELELHVLEGRVRVDSTAGGKGEIIQAKSSVLLAGAEIQRKIERPALGFLSQLPPKIDMLLKEDFQHGLLADQNYIIRMDPTVIRDLSGNKFQGINDDTTWNFTTTRTSAPITVASYSSDIAPDPTSPWIDAGGELTDGNLDTSDSIVGWNGDPSDKGSFPTITFDLGKIHDVQTIDLSVRNTNGTIHSVIVTASTDGVHYSAPVTFQPSWSGINPATTQLDMSALTDARYYQLRLVSTDWAMLSEVEFKGAVIRSPDTSAAFSDHGLDAPMKLKPNPNQPLTQGDTSPPVVIAVYPDDATDSITSGQLKMLFNEPIKFGTGRVIIQDVTGWNESTLVVGSSELSIKDRVVTLTPPIDLEDGTHKLGWLAGWEAGAAVTFLNPGGKGKDYHHDDLKDNSPSRGIIGSMRSTGMISIKHPIRREIGTIIADSRYTISTDIGVRADDAKATSTFSGYTIRLTSGKTTLAKLTSDTPPGPVNSVSTVGFSWDATTLPEGVHPGAPLSIEIIPDPSIEPGYLDLNALRISVLNQSGRSPER